MREAELANQAWESLLTAQSRLMRGFRAESMWDGLGMADYDVLYTLSKLAGPVRMSTLGCSVLLSQPGLSRLVDRLVGRGLVERHPDPADGRSVLVDLTPSGRKVQKDVGRRHARSVAAAMSVLGSDELARLKELADKLSAGPEQADDAATQTPELKENR